MINDSFDTLTEAMQYLNKEGFNEDFKAEEHHMLALVSKKKYHPHELSIVKVFRFEGMTDPADSVELFAIRANDGLKGTLTLSYGAQQSQNAELIREIPMRRD